MKLSFRFFAMGVLCILSLTNTLKSQAFSFSVNPNYTICTGGNSNQNVPYYLNCVITNTVPGAGYYTFTLSPGCSIFSIVQSNSSYTIGVWSSSAGIHTVTGIAYVSINNPSVIASMNQTIAVLAGPSVAISSPSTICANTTYSFSASGANSYTWNSFNGQSSNSLTGAAVTLTSGTQINYTLQATAASGCKYISSFSPVVGSATVNIAPQNTICAGSSCTLAATGAQTYTWSIGSTASSIIVSPSVTTVYTLASNNGNCISTSTHTIVVANNINVFVNSNMQVCLGSISVLSATGANTYTWMPSGLMGATIAVNPSVSTCYTVIGSNGACTASAISCVSVLSVPALSVGATTSLICLGSSIIFTASGAASYTWSTGSMGNSIQVIPTSPISIYSVIASHNVNACTNTKTVTVPISTACAIVWPGDANRDGTVSNADVLELGLQANLTGPARTFTSNAWTAQQASAWNGTISTGWNRVHADCNGDGVVSNADITAINTNFNLNHAFKSVNIIGQDVQLIFPAPLQAGAWNKADVWINTNSTYYGLAFNTAFQSALIMPDSIKLIYSTSFLNSNSGTYDFYKPVFNNGLLYGATVRTNHTDVIGNGKIAEIWFKLNVNAGGQTLTMSIAQAQKVVSSGLYTSLIPEAPVSGYISPETGIASLTDTDIAIFPNPAADLIYINPVNKSLPYYITDLSGRTVQSGLIENNCIYLNSLQTGLYTIHVKQLHKPLQIIH